MSEHLHQVTLFDYFRHPLVLKKYPDADILFSTLNGVRLSKAQAGKAKAAGMLAGVYDVWLPVRRGDCPGLLIEMKFGDGRLSKEQKWFRGRMLEQGWLVAETWDWIAARDAIVEYLTLPKEKNGPV